MEVLPICENPICQKEAKLQCPTCLKMKLKPSFFCSQDCFKASWNEHKVYHVQPHPLNYPNFSFSGPLRPWEVTPKRKIPPHIKKPDYADNGVPHSEEKASETEIYVNTQEEQEGIKEACILARKVLDEAHKVVGVGVTTDEIDRVVHETSILNEAYPSPFNYYHFPKSVCTSVNEVICHGIPNLRPLEDGDIVNVDITVYKNGFHGDVSETYFVGNVAESSKQLVKCAYECLWKGIEICKPDVPFKKIGDAIQKVADSYNFSIVRSFCGHGVGKLFHSAPNVPHYKKNNTHGIMTPGHVFTIEPMINQGNYKDILWPDNWTAATIDGQRSAQFEHTLLITENGVEVLTNRNPNSPALDFI